MATHQEVGEQRAWGQPKPGPVTCKGPPDLGLRLPTALVPESRGLGRGLLGCLGAVQSHHVPSEAQAPVRRLLQVLGASTFPLGLRCLPPMNLHIGCLAPCDLRGCHGPASCLPQHTEANKGRMNGRPAPEKKMPSLD